MNIMAHKTKEKTKENTKEKTKEIFLDCLVWKTLEFTKDITMDFGSRESLEIGNQGIDQAPRNIPWVLGAGRFLGVRKVVSYPEKIFRIGG